MLGLVGLSALGFNIPVLRQVIGFIYLTFIPGLLILRIFRLNKLSIIETLLYSVGLGIACVMFLGFLMNMLYPLIGIPRPISTYPVIATMTVVVLILCAIAHKRWGSRKEPLSQDGLIQRHELLSPPTLFLFLLPILSALGVFLVFLFHNNTVLLLLFSLIAIVPILIVFGKFIPEKLYPLAIMSIGIALLWQCSLLSFDLPDGDILVEYYYQGVVLRNSLWDATVTSNVNAMLSVAMLAPIYSLVLNLNTVWVYKIIYPLLYSLVPLVLFQVYRKQTGDKIAFLGAFFFLSFPEFFSTMPSMPRQIVAELFIALSLLLFVSKEMTSIKRATLLIIFGLAIVVSHYGTSYIYMFYLFIALPLLLLWRSSTVNKAWRNVVTRFGKFRDSVRITRQSPKLVSEPPSPSTLTGTYVMLFIVFCLAFYMYVSSGSPFNTLVRVSDHMYSALSTDFFSLLGREAHVMQALGLAPMRGSEIGWSIARIFQYITQFFIVVGIIKLMFNHRKTKFHLEYVAMIFPSMVLIAMSIILPYFAAAYNMTRIYHLTLLFLAPVCILGGITTFRWLFRVLRLRRPRGGRTSLKLVVVLVLVPYFLFTTGFIFHLTGATPTSASLSYDKADWPFYTKAEIRASDWLLTIPDDKLVYCDSIAKGLMRYHYEVRTGVKSTYFPDDVKNIGNGSYIFLRRWNVIHGEILPRRETGQAFKYTSLDEMGILEGPGRSKIYTNNDAQIWWYRK